MGIKQSWSTTDKGSSSTSSSHKECCVEEAMLNAAEFVTTESKHFKDVVGNSLVPTTTAALESMADSVNLSQRIEHFVIDNVTAVSIGALFGSAVAAGIGVGLVAASSMVHHIPTLWKYTIRRYYYGHTKASRRLESKMSSSSSTIADEQQVDGFVGSPLLFFQISSRATKTDELLIVGILTDQMAKTSLKWSQLRRITAYIADCDINVRQLLERHVNASTVLTIVYVQRLENPSHNILLDVIASC